MEVEQSVRRANYEALASSIPGARARTLSSCAGLTLCAANAPHQLVLRDAIEVLAGQPRDDLTNRPTSQALSRWLRNHSELGHLYIPPGLHCEELVVSEGGFRIFPGIFEDEQWVAKVLLDLVLGDDLLPQEFRVHARDCLLSVLHISEEIAKRADVERNTQTEFSSKDLVVPTGATLDRLAASVVFSDRELASMLSPNQLRHLTELTVKVGDIELADSQADSELWCRPLVRCDELGVIVALPDTLLLAARHRVIGLAFLYGCQEQLAETFGLGVVDSARCALAQMGMLADMPAPAEEQPVFDRAEMVLPCDRDKLCHLMVVWDDLADYDLQRPHGVWTSGPTRAQLEQRFRDVTELLYTAEDAPNEIMHCVVVQSLGRPYQLVVDTSGPSGFAPRIVFSAPELEIVARLEEPDIALPWKFATAAQRLRQELPLAPISQLEEWGYWRENSRSFGLLEGGALQGDDESPPEFAGIAGHAMKLRGDLAARDDPHGLLASGGRFVAVKRLWPDTDAPIVVGDRLGGLPVILAVEGLALPLWVVPREKPGSLDGVVEYRRYAELFAYWIWQLAPSTLSLWQALSRLTETFTLAIAIGSAKDGWTVDATAAGRIEVSFGKKATQLLSGTDNTVERELMKEVLEAVRSCAGGARGSEVLGDAELEMAIVRHMSPPERRKLLCISDEDPAFEPLAVPYRGVSDADAMAQRRSVGRVIVKLHGLEPGTGEADVALTLLKDAVAETYGALQSLVGTLEPDGLLELLVSFNEALIHRHVVDHVERGLALSLWGPASAVTRRGADEIAAANRASIASRFLIEYVTAQPPAGLRPVSYEVYDQLMAMAALIVDWGMSADLLREGLADIAIAISPSGHFLNLRDSFDSDAREYVEVLARAEPVRAVQWLEARDGDHVFAERESADFDVFGELDPAWLTETGHTFSECVGALATISGLESSPVKGGQARAYEEVVRLLAHTMGFEPSKARDLIELFVLRPRSDFLDPPAGFQRNDLWPWRFNRRLSYLRRPLLARPSASGEDLVFGARQLFLSVDYISRLVHTGRLKVSSGPIKDYMSKVQQAEARAFNDAVAMMYDEHDFSVRARVDRFGPRKMLDEQGNDLGDIDVLVVDAQRRTILCIEVKDLAGALAPHQLANELRATFSVGGSHRSHAEKHQRRVAWIAAHVSEVLDDVGYKDARAHRWRVEGLIVTDEEVLASFIGEPPLPVRDFLTLKAALDSGHLY
ncbi:MAG TPA: hypothetical protein VHY18_02320 [Solirubrobacteraceae bacterium]|nr:hypothetical protein [Solirubrobacteraceae bacterium]